MWRQSHNAADKAAVLQILPRVHFLVENTHNDDFVVDDPVVKVVRMDIYLSVNPSADLHLKR